MHQYRVRDPGTEKDPNIPDWTFNGDVNVPDFKPSMLIFEPLENGGRRTICHYFINNGSIFFCADSPHAMKGQTVPLPDLPEGYRD